MLTIIKDFKRNSLRYSRGIVKMREFFFILILEFLLNAGVYNVDDD